MTRPFVSEITILQRERNPDTPMVLWTVGCLVVLVCTLIMIGGLTWGAGRINRESPPTRRRSCSHRHRHDRDRWPRTSSILAHHSLLLAIPAFVPAFIVAGVVAYIAMKDRRNRDGPHSEEPGSHRPR